MSFQRNTLPNGVRVVSETLPHIRSVAVGIWVKTGSRYESEALHGVTHFLEHLMFKGTKERTARDIAEQMDAVGGQLNAFTAKEYTCFYARVLSDHFPFAVELLSDMLLESLIEPGDLAREKSVILEEIKLYEDTPDELIHDLCARAVLGRHPLGRQILGTTETVSGLERDDVMDFWRRHYTPDNIIIAVAGQVEHSVALDCIEKHFGRMSGSHAPQALDGAPDNGSDIYRDKETEQVHVCLGVQGLSRNSKERFAVQVLDALLGGSVSSRLFQELREERGLVYSAFSSHAAYQDTGLFSVYLGVSPENLITVLELVRHEFNSVRKDGIGADEVARAKEQLRGSVLIGLESTSTRMSRLAKAEMFFGELLPVDDLIERIMSVSREEVAAVAAQLFAVRPNLAVIGPLGELDAGWEAAARGWFD